MLFNNQITVLVTKVFKRNWFFFSLIIFFVLSLHVFAGTFSYQEAPSLKVKVDQGVLPRLLERLPTNPAIATLPWPNQTPGSYGGVLTTLGITSKDTRLMTVYSNVRLINYDKDFNLVPDLLESFDVQDNKIFTFHLRSNHRWSDGYPFTTEDFRYYWEDIANNEDLSPNGPPLNFLVKGEKPKVEIIDDTTIRYSWNNPNNNFLPMLAGPNPLYLYRPSHYLKKFHKNYTKAEDLDLLIKQERFRNWAPLHNRKDNMYRNDNPDLPTLDPWVLSTKPPADRFVFIRNPYYYKIDPEGHQLPYIDEVIWNITDNKIVPAKVAAGEVLLQARYLRFDNYTFLKESEKRGIYKVNLWKNSTGSAMALYPNLNINDKIWHDLFNQVNFRRALSLGIDRHEINQIIYYGLAEEGANTILQQSPLFKDTYKKKWATYDPAMANKLLDDLGLNKKNDEGIRLLKDGRPLEIIVEAAGQVPEEIDILQLIGDSWKKIGIKIFIKSLERDYFRNRIFSGQTMLSVWTGLENGLPNTSFSPAELAPTSQQHLQWPKWGQYFETNGESGQPVRDPEAQKLMDLLDLWYKATSSSEKESIWHQMLEIFSDQVYSIGTVSETPQPIVISKKLHNIPEQGIYSWEPGGYIGMYNPDTFWFDQ
ncbi:MAG: ABC transporter substrate-binding protein [Alphaproteobacteria bacterium]|nr:ABC transporter substrate-binding protein [Alphaproteobacteria bacterium]